MFDNINEKRIPIFGDFIKKNLETGSSIVEVGCDTGKLSEMLKNNYNVFMVDLSDNREYAKELTFQIMDVTKECFPFEDNSINCVVATQVIEHLTDLTFFFNEVHRILKPDGKIIISYPNYSNLFQRLVFTKNGMPVRLGGTINSGGHINFLPFKFLQHWLSPKYTLAYVEGDYITSVAWMPKICSIFNKIVKNKHFMLRNKSLLLSYNVNVVFYKK